MIKQVWIPICILLCAFPFIEVHAEVKVFPLQGPQLRSQKYFVRILQGEKVYESVVYKGENMHKGSIGLLTDRNHWTDFAFSEEITIEITKLFGDPIRFCIVRPKELRLKPEVNGHVARIAIKEPQMLYVEINEAEGDPLFIFANPLFNVNIPVFDTNWIYFGPGEHKIGNNYKVVNKNVFIEGGAYVLGTFAFEGDVPMMLTGNGILSGILNAKGPGQGKYPLVKSYAPILYIEGLTFTDPNAICVQSEYKVDIKNAKFLGWSPFSKGVQVGEGSVIHNCFFKLNNDVVTFNHSGISLSNSVVWQQAKGAPFQFSIYEKKNFGNINIQNVDIIRVDNAEDSIWTSNKTIVNCLELSNSHINNVVISNLRVEGNVHRLLGIHTGAGGIFENLVFKDVKIEGVLTYENFISANKGRVGNILFDNVEANYMKITTAYDAYIEKRGDVGEIEFKWKNY
jgi:hypothetical protein